MPFVSAPFGGSLTGLVTVLDRQVQNAPLAYVGFVCLLSTLPDTLNGLLMLNDRARS